MNNQELSQQPIQQQKNTDRLSDEILGYVRQRLGADDEDDTSYDNEINMMTNNELFDEVLNWIGIIGYGNDIRLWIDEIYGTSLNSD